MKLWKFFDKGYINTTRWSGIAGTNITKLDRALTPEEIQSVFGYTVLKDQLARTSDGQKVAAHALVRDIEVGGAPTRVTLYPSVGNSYTVVQNDILTAIMASIASDESAAAEIEAALTFDNGQKAMLVLYAGDIASDDVHDVNLYLIFVNHHGGRKLDTMAVIRDTVTGTFLRVNNATETLKNLCARFTHTEKVMERLQDYSVSVTSLRAQLVPVMDMLRALSHKRLDQGGVSAILARLFPLKEGTEGRKKTYIEETRKKILGHWTRLNNVSPLGPTAYGLFLACQVWSDQDVVVRNGDDAYTFIRSLIGETADDKVEFLDRIQDIIREQEENQKATI